MTASRRILVAEDEIFLAMMLQDLLEDRYSIGRSPVTGIIAPEM